MKSRFLFGIFLAGTIALFTETSAQEKLPWKNSYYKYKISQKSREDTIPTLFCVLKLEELRKYNYIYINYSDKVKKYATKHILKEPEEDCKIEGDMIYFKINKSLNEPFVVITEEDMAGQRYTIYEHNDRGELIDPMEERIKWIKAADRLDSIEYVRKFDNVYIGKDGKPRYRDRNGKVYLIERSGNRLDNGNKNN